MTPTTLTSDQVTPAINLLANLASYPIEGDADFEESDENIYTDSENLYAFVNAARKLLGWPTSGNHPGLAAALERVRDHQRESWPTPQYDGWMKAEARLQTLGWFVKSGQVTLP